MNPDDVEKLEKYMQRVFAVGKPTPKLTERYVKATRTYEGFDAKTGKVYILYGPGFRAAVRKMAEKRGASDRSKES